MKDLSGKWALVTGASRGIGQQIAVALAKRGCNIILHARKEGNLSTTQELIKEYAIETKFIGALLDSEEEVQKIIDFTLKEVGYVDYLFNNAGIQNEWVDTYKNGVDIWKMVFQVNLFYAVQLCNAFIPIMIDRDFGRVINTTSDIEGVPEMASYGAAKIAITKMTSEFAYSLEGTNVKINALDPGWLKTDLGGLEAPKEVTTVIPGAIATVITDDIPNGVVFHAQELSEIEG